VDASEAVNEYPTKVKAVYDASDLYGVPAHVLTGAIYQESLFSPLGISDDGGNFSCGMEQINLNGLVRMGQRTIGCFEASDGLAERESKLQQRRCRQLKFY